MSHKTEINWRFLFLAYLSLFCLALIDNGRGPAYPKMLSLLELTTSEGSYLFSLASMVGIAVNLSARWWIFPIGAVRSSRLALFLMAIGSLLLSFSGYYKSYPLFISSALFGGIGLAVCAISMNLLVIQGTPEERRKNYFAGLHSIYGIASLLAPFIIVSLAKFDYSWITYFSIASVICLFVTFWSLSISPIKEEDHLMIKKEEVYATPPFKTRFLFGLIFAFYVASEITISSRLVLFLKKAQNFSTETAGFYLSLFFASLLAGRLFFTFIRVKGSNQALMIISLLSTLLFFFFGYYIHPIGLALCGLSMSFFFPIAMDWLASIFPRRADFMTASAMTAISFMLGVIHWGFGQIAEHFSVELAMFIAPCCSLLSLFSLLLWRKNEKQLMMEVKN